jgi:hypothetical protein
MQHTYADDAVLSAAQRRVNRKAAKQRAECEAAFLDTARRSVARAVTNAAEGRKEFGIREILDYTELNEYDLRVLGEMLIQACDAGALRSSNDGLWQVLDRDALCSVAFKGI